MKVLLTNDDGYGARGLRALYSEITKIAGTIIIAPEKESSASGHAITVFDPIRVEEIYDNGNAIGYAVAGTPADCVKLGLTVILKEKPDIVISGVNLGPNVGTNIIYSGTVSAATEGTMLGIPSMAVSLDSFTDPDFTFAARFAARLAEIVVTRGLPEGTLLNVNVPAVKEEEIKGIKITRQGVSKFKEIFHKRIDPRNRTYYWLDGEFVESDFEPDIDIVALKNGMISITPIHYDMTNYRFLGELENWMESLYLNKTHKARKASISDGSQSEEAAASTVEEELSPLAADSFFRSGEL